MATDLAGERFINLESFKRDGSGVQTPVWCAPLGGKIVVVSAGSAYKVKRVRRNPRVRVAACDVRGKLLGPWHDGSCVIVEDPAHQQRAHAALRAKYGWIMTITDFFYALTRRKRELAVLEIALQ